MTKALILVTNHTTFSSPDVQPTGLWLSELTHFYDVFAKAGIEMEIASPKGGKIEIDARSLAWPVFDKATRKRFNAPQFMALLDNTPALGSLNWDEYDVIYLAGGHGAMWDFAEDPTLHRLIAQSYEQGKVVAAVCHGVAGLMNVRLSSGRYLLDGKRGTGFAYFDETIAGVKHLVPYNLQAGLKERGMRYSKALLPLMSHVVRDGQLITGQNPNSATGTAKAALAALEVRVSQAA